MRSSRAHVLIEAKKSQDLQLASQRTWKAHTVFQFQFKSEGLRTRRAESVSSDLSPNPRAKETQWSQLNDSQAERELFLTQRFILFQPSVHSMCPTHIGKGDPLHAVHRFSCQSYQKTPLQAHPKQCLTKYLGISVAQSI